MKKYRAMTTKTIIAALAVTVGAAFATQAVAKKDKKVTTAVPVEQPAKVNLVTGIDSLSYAAGQALTDGLIPYLQSQFKVDTAYMADFVQGMKDAVAQKNNPTFVARLAGAQIAQMVEQRMLPGIGGELKDTGDSINADLFYKGFYAACMKDSTLMSSKNAQAFFKARMDSDKKLRAERLSASGKAWLAANAKKDSVVTLPSGLQYKVITMGNGPKPTATQEVEVKYEGKLIDGTVFDSSYKRNPQTTKFKCNQVIKGWTEALQLMPVGSKWEIYVPQELGYGERPSGKIPAYSTLIFTVELEGITPDKAPEADKKADAKDAKKSAAKKPIAKKASKK